MKRILNHILYFMIALVICITSFAPASAKERNSVYLKSLSVNKSDICFSEDVFYYVAKVSDDTGEIKVRAKPKDKDSSVYIDGDPVYESDNYKKTVDLNNGINIIKVVVSNDDNESLTYTLNIIRGECEKDDVYLSGLKLNNENISLDKDNTEYSVDVDKDVNKINVTGIPEKDNSDVFINDEYVSVKNNYSTSVNLQSGANPIIVKVRNKKDEREYLITVNRKSSFNNENKQDNVFLYSIKLDKVRLNIDNEKTEYSAKVDEKVENIYVTAQPENTDYKVTINNKVVEDDDNYKKFLKLNKGKNIIKIAVQDIKNNKQRVYTVNIFRGIESDNLDTNKTSSKKVEINKWVKGEKGWQYIDVNGNPLKNAWHYDTNYGSWYYLDESGIMKTGWFKDKNGKWYFFDEHGCMLSNTYVGIYKLGYDGAAM